MFRAIVDTRIGPEWFPRLPRSLDDLYKEGSHLQLFSLAGAEPLISFRRLGIAFGNIDVFHKLQSKEDSCVFSLFLRLAGSMNVINIICILFLDANPGM